MTEPIAEKAKEMMQIIERSLIKSSPLFRNDDKDFDNNFSMIDNLRTGIVSRIPTRSQMLTTSL